MRPVYLALAVLACAPARGPGTPEPQAQHVRIDGRDSGLRLSSTRSARVDTLWVSVDKVWQTLPLVYGALDIPIERFDAEARVIGNSTLKVYRRLGKAPLTRYLDCGMTQIGPNAESYEIMLNVLTKITPSMSDSTITTVTTTVGATGRSIQFAGGVAQCSSKGTLEAQILEVLKVRLAS